MLKGKFAKLLEVTISKVAAAYGFPWKNGTTMRSPEEDS
jgi:hypothetical protein